MMLRVAGRNIRQRADRNFIPIGNASARLGLRRQRTEQSDGRLADALEFGQQVVHIARVGLRFADVIVLLETAQFACIAARKAQSTVGHDSLGIAQVSKNLLNTPLSRRRGRGGRFVGYAHQELPVISKLLGEEIKDWALGNPGDIVFVKLSVFGGVGTGEHAHNCDTDDTGKQVREGGLSQGRSKKVDRVHCLHVVPGLEERETQGTRLSRNMEGRRRSLTKWRFYDNNPPTVSLAWDYWGVSEAG